MATESVFVGNRLALTIAVAGIAVISLAAAPKPGLAQAASDSGTASIQRGSDAERALKLEEPSVRTREERLKVKPLDWKSTIGKPKPRALTPAEKAALRKARPGATEGGAPNPKAEEEARKLHPDDWK